MEFSTESQNTNIPNIDSLTRANYTVSNNDIIKELQLINKNLSTIVNDIKEILSILKESSEIKNNKKIDWLKNN